MEEQNTEPVQTVVGEEMNSEVEPQPISKTDSKPTRVVVKKKDDQVHPRALSKWEELERRGLIVSKTKK